ncbi:class I SAM-dependent methyltransferase [Nemorincola caseinilytica]|uniref:Class I SAM-dependent methyltransferase n=1 Tax=Nemorincola caseinilytica TaxID=2054315 RepID=A0ABP8N161_9BACT
MANKNVLRLKKAIHSFNKQLRSDPHHLAYMGNKYHCPVCRTGLSYFNPMSSEYLQMLDDSQHVFSLFAYETINILRYQCPRCYASDRDRLYALYIEKRLGTNCQSRYNMLDIAPTEALESYLRASSCINYRSADLFNPKADDKVDITDMNIYTDGRFDIFICSHVLEHVPDDNKAMRELRRVLKPGGWGIAMVPICLAIEETLQDDKIQTDIDRWKYYGQNDHVRAYSKKGFVTNLKNAGFKVNELGINDFGKEQFERCGIHPRSVLYIVE